MAVEVLDKGQPALEVILSMEAPRARLFKNALPVVVEEWAFTVARLNLAQNTEALVEQAVLMLVTPPVEAHQCTALARAAAVVE